LSASSLSLDEDFYGNEIPLKRPSKLFFAVGLLSVLLGTLIGVYGIISANTASTQQQYLTGAAGYVLTALLPIIVLQVILVRNTNALALNEEEPYDSYAGEQMQNRFRKVVLVGLVSAGLSIWVFFQPIAERFAA